MLCIPFLGEKALGAFSWSDRGGLFGNGMSAFRCEGRKDFVRSPWAETLTGTGCSAACPLESNTLFCSVGPCARRSQASEIS